MASWTEPKARESVLHLPATREEVLARGWDCLDIVLVTGDALVDHPSFPAALLGRLLEAEGFRVGVIPRPDPSDPADVARLGLPRLFFGVTAGALDSMVSNYTAARRRRSDDPYAPGGRAGGRPDRALTVYANLIRRAFGKEAFIVAGGLEASLRRFAHYDFWSDSIRRPILMDCGADVLVHGMGEGPVVAIARCLAELGPATRREVRLAAVRDIPGVVWRYPAREPAPTALGKGSVALPSFEEVASSPAAHARAFRLAERNAGRQMWQECSGMRVVANPPWPPLRPEELDRIYALPFTRDVHPVHGGQRVPALEQVRFSVTTHRGCAGGCAFCAIGAHQGKTVQSRSEESVLEEVGRIARHPDFRGTVPDLGGPTANMYGLACGRRQGPCSRPSCLWPSPCSHLNGQEAQDRYLALLRRARHLPGVRHLFVTTGIRMDLALLSEPLLRDLAFCHTSGHLKVAPEHLDPRVLRVMRKPSDRSFEAFLETHRRLSRAVGRKQYVLPYFIAAHPGCRLQDMVEVALFLRRERLRVEQCQVFTPTPGTAATVMYATGLDPATGRPVHVERDPHLRELQKALILHHLPENAPKVREALERCGRADLIPVLLGVRRVSPAAGEDGYRRGRGRGKTVLLGVKGASSSAGGRTSPSGTRLPRRRCPPRGS